MGRIYWSCPISSENLTAQVQPGTEFHLHLSAAAREALEAVGGPEAETQYWQARRDAARGNAKAAQQEQELAHKARRWLAGER
jgi:hypothetical protein